MKDQLKLTQYRLAPRPPRRHSEIVDFAFVRMVHSIKAGENLKGCDRVSKRGGRCGLQIEVTVRHTSVAPEMKAYARSKAERLLKYYNRIQAIRVLLDHGGGGFSCEMIANVEHAPDLVAHTMGPDLRAAVDQTVDRVERQVIELKKRTRHRKGRGPNPHQPTRT